VPGFACGASGAAAAGAGDAASLAARLDDCASAASSPQTWRGVRVTSKAGSTDTTVAYFCSGLMPLFATMAPAAATTTAPTMIPANAVLFMLVLLRPPLTGRAT
jgi:hypothetical protein